ncbi:hypothetical protein ACFVDI_23775 [Nocardioides sp. NPDC057767]|uniref:hypothetical protein n=1 Tax=unclassified Nocardioides TaxID=2615069 RepID=UPI00366AE556
MLSDITDGLEAGFSELVEERGPDALGDPAEYAKELRAAAGIPAGQPAPRGFGEQVDGFLDAGHDRFDAAVAKLGELLRTDLRPAVAWLRPLWWIVRAWAAVWLVSALFGWGMSSAPAVVLLLVAVVVSMFIGAGRVWPGGERGTLARVVLLGLNVFAAFVLFMTWASGAVGGVDYDQGWNDGFNEAVAGQGSPIDQQAGVYSDGKWVSNIYPYDASGKPLNGVQLFDQEGKPIDVVTQPDCTSTSAAPLPPLAGDDLNMAEVACTDEMTGEPLQARIFYPWSNGAAQLYNVFPLPSRVQPWTAPDPNAFADGSQDAPGDPGAAAGHRAEGVAARGDDQLPERIPERVRGYRRQAMTRPMQPIPVPQRRSIWRRDEVEGDEAMKLWWRLRRLVARLVRVA